MLRSSLNTQLTGKCCKLFLTKSQTNETNVQCDNKPAIEALTKVNVFKKKNINLE